MHFKKLKESLNGKVLPAFRKKLLMKPAREKVLVAQVDVQPKTGSLYLSFSFNVQGLVALWIKAVLIINMTAFVQNCRVSLSLPALNSDASVHY